MRYLGRFPSEAQVQFIMPRLLEDPNRQTVTYDRVEPYLLDLLDTTDFMPASYSTLMSCFKRLDKQNSGMIKLDRFIQMIRDSDLKFLPEEEEAMIDALPKDQTGKNFFYEDYVFQLIETTNKHNENVYKLNLVSKDSK